MMTDLLVGLEERGRDSGGHRCAVNIVVVLR